MGCYWQAANFVVRMISTLCCKRACRTRMGGVIGIEQTALEEFKKEKGSLKDRMAVLIKEHHSVGAV